MDGATAESGYQVLGCERHEPWWDNSVQLQGARGIRYRQLASKKGRELVKSLKPGTFVVVEDRNGHWSESPFLIGVTVACNGDSCISKELYTERETHKGTRYDPGDCAVAIRWLTRASEDAEQRTFELDTDSELFLVNSTELRHVSLHRT